MKSTGTFDIESLEWIHFLVAGTFDGDRVKFHKTLDSLIDEFDDKRFDRWVWYAHNGGKFDFLFLVENMERRGWDIDFLYAGSRIVTLKVSTGRHRFELRDSLGILRGSLRELAQSFGVDHKKGEIDYEAMSKVTKELLVYLENDCRALYEILERFSSLEYMAELQPTIASQAMKVFSENFCKSKLIRTDEKVGRRIRALFYHGGRCEVFKFRGEGLYYYDVNSLYPFAMLGAMPCGDIEFVRKERRDLIGFYRVRIKATPDYYVSPLLYSSGRNRYVKGSGVYNVGSPTLEILREQGVHYEVIDGYVASSREVLFDDYVKHFFEIKQSSRGTSRYVLAKLMLNSLYGKFGQKYEQQKIVRYDELADNEDNFHHTDHPDYVLVPEKTRSRFLLPFLAAYITERARAIHYRYMSQAPHSMYYCDTDSLITSAQYPSGAALGELSLKGVFDFACIGCKSYALRSEKGESITFKGFSSRSYSFRNFEEMLSGDREFLTESRDEVLSFLEVQNRVNGIKDRVGKYLAVVHRRKFQSFQYDGRLMVPDPVCVYDTETLTTKAADFISEKDA